MDEAIPTPEATTPIAGTVAANTELAPSPKGSLSGDSGPLLAQTIIAAMLVAVMVFLVHYNVVYAPFAGPGDDLLVETPALHNCLTAPAVFENTEAAPAGYLAMAMLWQSCGGTSFGVRFASLLLHTLSALAVFMAATHILRARPNAATAMALALLFAFASQAAPLLVSASQLGLLLGLALVLWGAIFAVNASFGPATALLCFALGYAVAPGLWLTGMIAILLLAAPVGASWTKGALRGILPCMYGLGMVCFAQSVTAGAMDIPIEWSWYPLSAVAALLLARLTTLPLPAPGLYALRIAVALAVLAAGGKTFYDTMLLQNAQDRLIKSADTHPNDPAVWRSLAYFAERQALNTKDDASREAVAQQARRAYAKAVELDPNNTSLLTHAAAFYLKAGEPASASEMADRVLRSAPFAHDAADTARLAAMGRIASATNPQPTPEETARLREALALFNFSVQRGSKLAPEVAGQYGMALLVGGRMEAAEPWLATAAGALPESPFANGLAKCKAVRTQRATLEKTAREKLTANPTDIGGIIAHTEQILLAGRLTSALYTADTALRQAPDNATTWALMGLVRGVRGESDRFLAENTGQTDPERWADLTRRCMAFGAAEAALGYVVRTNPPAGQLPEEQLAAYAGDMKQPAMAEQWLRRALTAHTDSWNPALSLARLAHQSGRDSEVRQWLDEARRRGAPETALNLEQAPAPPTAPATPQDEFKPVRTVIQ